VLGTPLRVEQLCEGFFEALRKVFLVPALLLFGFSYASVFAEPLGDAFAKASVASLAGVLVVALVIAIVVMLALLDLWAVSWFGLWMGLRWGKPGPAVTRTVLFVLVLPLLAAFFCLPAALVVLMLKNFAFMSRGREQLQRRFRAIVAGEVALDTERSVLRVTEARPPALPNVLDG
jgi:hypothetical protein